MRDTATRRSTVLVLDASVVIAASLPDETVGDLARVLMDRVAALGAIVPALWHIEVGNALLSNERRGRVQQGRIGQITTYLRSLPIAVDSETHLHAWETTMNLSRRHRLTLYDAAYLELALRRRFPLASFDGRLCSAAVAEKVETLTGAPT